MAFEIWILKLISMPSPYQEFVRKAKERFQAQQKQKSSPASQFQFTAHADYKMKQYGLSVQKVKGVIRRPQRTEVGIAPKTVAVMQPVSAKVVDGKEMWKQEIWVMYVVRESVAAGGMRAAEKKMRNFLQPARVRIISAWRYPGVSPKRNPIPEEIWQELTEGSIMEE